MALALGLISTAFVKELTIRVLICSTMKRQLATSAFIMMPGVCLMLSRAGRYLAGDWGATATPKIRAVGKLAATQHLRTYPLIHLVRGLLIKPFI